MRQRVERLEEARRAVEYEIPSAVVSQATDVKETQLLGERDQPILERVKNGGFLGAAHSVLGLVAHHDPRPVEGVGWRQW